MAGKLMQRRKGKPFNPVAKVVDSPAIHDRRAREEDLLRNANVAVMEVEDPLGLEPGDKITVLRSLRSDPLAQLHARGYIDDAQYQGGRSFQGDWERAERGPRAIDPAKEYVDGGLPAEPISDGQRAAVARLNRAEGELGAVGISLTHDVLVAGLNLSEVARRRGLSGRAAREYFGQRFRECLDTLAVVYGFANGRKKTQDIALKT
jgi:hypothetical protein